MPILKERNLKKQYLELKRHFISSEINKCSKIKSFEPNNKLLYDEKYRKVWLLFNWLNKLEKEEMKDEENKDNILLKTNYYLILSRLINKYNLILADKIKNFSNFLQEEEEKEENLLFLHNKSEEKVIKIKLKNKKIILNEKELSNCTLNILNKDLIDKKIEECGIKTAYINDNLLSNGIINKKDYCNPYSNYRDDNLFLLIYLNKGFKLNPKIDFAVENFNDSLKNINSINVNSNLENFVDFLKLNKDFVHLISDNLERDDYYKITPYPIPMSIALELSELDQYEVGKKINIINYFSSPVTETTLVVKKDKSTGKNYFLRKLPKNLENQDSVEKELLNKINETTITPIGSKTIISLDNFNFDNNIKKLLSEFLILKEKIYIFFNSVWYKFELKKESGKLILKHKFELKKESDKLIITHPIVETENNNWKKIESGIKFYQKESLRNKRLLWKEEVIPLSMYLPDESVKRVIKFELVNENIELDYQNKKQNVSPSKADFNLPKGLNDKFFTIKFNKDWKQIKVKYPAGGLEKDLKCKLEATYKFEEKQPYSFQFKSDEKIIEAEIINLSESLNKKDLKIPEANPNIFKNDDFKEIESKDLSKLARKWLRNKNFQSKEELINLIESKTKNLKITEKDNIKRRVKLIIDNQFLKEFLKECIFGENIENINLTNYLRTLAYVFWFREDRVKYIFEKLFTGKESEEKLKKLLLILNHDFHLNYIKEFLKKEEPISKISNYIPLLFLALLKLNNSENKKLREIISDKNPIVLNFLEKLYKYDEEIEKILKDKSLNCELHGDGCNLKINDEKDKSLENMHDHTYLIYKYVHGHNPLISIEIQ